MAGGEGFGALLKRFADHRQLEIGALSRLAGASEPELLSLFHGGAPSPSVLRRLAPALGLHTADLFVIAGVDVPDDLTPVDTSAGWRVPGLVRHAVALPPEKRAALRRFAASLPREEHTQPVPKLPLHEQYPAGPGALLMRMARNRNLDWSAAARTFLVVTGRYWSPATYGGVGHGHTRLTPELLGDFSTVLGVPVGDLAALTGVALPGASSNPGSAAADVAELIWEVRHLAASQLRQVSDRAESMRQ